MEEAAAAAAAGAGAPFLAAQHEKGWRRCPAQPSPAVARSDSPPRTRRHVPPLSDIASRFVDPRPVNVQSCVS
jgi:hypothetical protein